MKALLFFPHFNTPKQASSLRSWQIGRFLASRGHDVTIFAPGVDMRSEQPFPEMQGRVYGEFLVEGVKLIRPYSLSNFRRSALRRLLFELLFAFLAFVRALFLSRPDVVVGSSPPAMIAPFAYLLSRIWRRPFVYEVRDLMADYLSANRYVKSGLFNRLARAIEVFVVRRSDALIAVSPGIKRALIEYGAKPETITVITNGYEPDLFESACYDWDPRAVFGWNDCFVVIYAGGLTHSYDIPTLLRAARRLRTVEDMMFVIIGEGNRKEEYLAYCQTNSLSSCQFLNYQPRDKMPVILAAADVGVHLFRDDPLWTVVLGNKTFDYLGSGIPMVYAGRGDTADLIETAQAGIVVAPGDDIALADALLWLRDHKEECKVMGIRGQSFVRKFYDRFALLEDYERVLIHVGKD